LDNLRRSVFAIDGGFHVRLDILLRCSSSPYGDRNQFSIVSTPSHSQARHSTRRILPSLVMSVFARQRGIADLFVPARDRELRC
jgi:hypothetical protein